MTERPATAASQDSGSRRDRRVGSLRLDLRRDRDAPAAARAAVERWCPELAGGRPRHETLLLLVSEVVTNAVMHSHAGTDAPVLLTATVLGDTVRVEVTDGGEGFTPPSYETSQPPQRMTIGGYGLYVINQAARRWGVDREGGTRVWFET
ncbi:MAG TPA: ATP-binding protein [Solirubrobacteraceae bacterium]|nr:ATP-binding protein [Solirubrobacteraceae bacterium]